MYQAKDKALPVEKAKIATQTDYIEKVKTIQGDDGTPTELALEELEKAMEQTEGKEKGTAKGGEDRIITDGLDNADGDREMYEDLSGYDDENEALVAVPPATNGTPGCSTFCSRTGWEANPTRQHPLGAHHLTITDRFLGRW